MTDRSKYPHDLFSYLNNTDLGISLLDAHDQKLFYSNRRLNKILGYTNRDIIPELDKNIYHEDDMYLHKNIQPLLFGSSLQPLYILYRLKDNSGRWQWIHSRFHACGSIRNINSKILVVISFELAPDHQISLNLRNFLSEITCKEKDQKLKELTFRERQVLTLVAQGRSYSQIATALNIQPDTVNKHRKSIQNKLKLRSIAELACFAKDTGLV